MNTAHMTGREIMSALRREYKNNGGCAATEDSVTQASLKWHRVAVAIAMKKLRREKSPTDAGCLMMEVDSLMHLTQSDLGIILDGEKSDKSCVSGLLKGLPYV